MGETIKNIAMPLIYIAYLEIAKNHHQRISVDA